MSWTCQVNSIRKASEDGSRCKNNLECCIDIKKSELSEAIDRLLKLPTIASKNFLITIGDRSVGSMIRLETRW